MTANPSISTRVGAGAHRGKVREENQDRISRFRSPFGEVFLVADGMGGHEGGGVAAQMLINGMERHLQAFPPETPPGEALHAAASRTNAEIYQQASSGDPRTAKMGSTCVLVLLKGRSALVAHAGDSRAYLLRRGTLNRLTRDHTVVQRMLDSKMLTEEEARDHPDSNIVTRAFGQKPEVELEISSPIELWPGDRLLLCSDGLCGYVEDLPIQQALESEDDAQAATDRLINLALQAGGEDNVSVQVIVVDEALPLAVAPPRSGRSAAPAPRQRRGFPSWMPMAALLVVAVGAGAFIVPRLFKDDKAAKKDDQEIGLEASSLPAEEEEPGEEPFQDQDLTEDTTPPEGEIVSDEAEDTSSETPSVTVDEPEAKPDPGSEKKGTEKSSTQSAIRRLIIVGRKIRQEISQKLSWPQSSIKLLSSPNSPFEEGFVYFRAGNEEAAKKVLGELEKYEKADYKLEKWPARLDGEHPDYQVLVSLRVTAPKPAVTDNGAEARGEIKKPEPSKDQPTVQQPEDQSSSEGGRPNTTGDGATKVNPRDPQGETRPSQTEEAPGAEQNVASVENPNAGSSKANAGATTAGKRISWRVLAPRGPHEGVPDRIKTRSKKWTWSNKTLKGDLEKILMPGYVYYQPGFEEEAAEVAHEMHYEDKQWPGGEALLELKNDYDILIVLKAKPASNKKDGSNR